MKEKQHLMSEFEVGAELKIVEPHECHEEWGSRSKIPPKNDLKITHQRRSAYNCSLDFRVVLLAHAEGPQEPPRVVAELVCSPGCLRCGSKLAMHVGPELGVGGRREPWFG